MPIRGKRPLNLWQAWTKHVLVTYAREYESFATVQESRRGVAIKFAKHMQETHPEEYAEFVRDFESHTIKKKSRSAEIQDIRRVGKLKMPLNKWQQWTKYVVDTYRNEYPNFCSSLPSPRGCDIQFAKHMKNTHKNEYDAFMRDAPEKDPDLIIFPSKNEYNTKKRIQELHGLFEGGARRTKRRVHKKRRTTRRR